MDKLQQLPSLTPPIHPGWEDKVDLTKKVPLCSVEVDLNQVLHFEKFLLTLWASSDDSSQIFISQVSESGITQNWQIHDGYELKLNDHPESMIFADTLT